MAKKKNDQPKAVVKLDGARPSGYSETLADIVARVRVAQVRAITAVNRELLALHWGIGQVIAARQERDGWGKGVVDQLAADLQKALPGQAGFSARNVWRMRAFYLAWRDEVTTARPPAADVLALAVREPDAAILPPAVAELPWSHNVILLEKLKDTSTRLWYARKTVEGNWSRNTLALQIDSKLHERQGGAVTNFGRTLAKPLSDLAQGLLKDPYNFDFLTLADDARERELEEGLVAHVRKFLLELGVGFAFVGSQYHLEVGGDDFYIDLLFYHCRLHCYFVIDLKMEEFQPEHAGKMNFYLSAVDDLVRDKAVDQPTLGLILCRKQNKLIAEYALRDISKPIGVAGFETRLVESLPKELEGKLPTVEALEEELAKLGTAPAEGGGDE